MKSALVIIESHEPDGVKWGLSTGGSNPHASEFLPLPSRTECERIKSAYDKGDIMPFLTASGALVEDQSK